MSSRKHLYGRVKIQRRTRNKIYVAHPRRFLSQKDFYTAEFGKEIVRFYYRHIHKPKTPAFIPNIIDNRTETHLFKILFKTRKFIGALFAFAILFFVPIDLLPQSQEEKTITGYVQNTQGQLWNNAVIELYEEDNLLGTDTLRNGYFELEHIITDVKETNNETPKTFKVYQNYPNPFSKGSGGNPSTTIRYELNKPSNIKIEIYDITGKEIKTLYNGEQGIGTYKVVWDAKNNHGQTVASGIYIYTIQTNK